MDKNIINRLKALENRVSEDLIIYAITENGELTEGRVKDIISENGELKKGYSGIGIRDRGKLVKSGKSLKDLERILSHFKNMSCVHNKQEYPF